MTEHNFEKFYMSKVALGEGCGCAERVIDVHEFNRLAGQSKVLPSTQLGGLANRLRLLALKFGIGGRSAGPSID